MLIYIYIYLETSQSSKKGLTSKDFKRGGKTKGDIHEIYFIGALHCSVHCLNTNADTHKTNKNSTENQHY